MELTASLNELLVFGLALVATGLVAGFLAGLFGIGGGAILVPLFDQFLGMIDVDPSVRMHLSVGTSLGIIVPTSVRSFLAHKARGAVDTEVLRGWLIAIPAGVALGAFVAAYVSADGLKVIFGTIAVIVALKLLFAKAHWRIGSDLPGQPVRGVVGVGIGFFSSLMGIGGGVLNNTFMTLYNRPIHQAVATSSGVGVLISIPGALGFMAAGWGADNLPVGSIGFVNLLGVALVIPLTLLVAPLGVKAAHALERRRLEIGFGIFLLIVAARFYASLL